MYTLQSTLSRCGQLLVSVALTCLVNCWTSVLLLHPFSASGTSATPTCWFGTPSRCSRILLARFFARRPGGRPYRPFRTPAFFFLPCAVARALFDAFGCLAFVIARAERQRHRPLLRDAPRGRRLPRTPPKRTAPPQTPRDGVRDAVTESKTRASQRHMARGTGSYRPKTICFDFLQVP